MTNTVGHNSTEAEDHYESTGRVTEEPDADARLHELNEDLSVELFREVVLMACRDYVTKINGYAPSTAKGTTIYDVTTMLLRGRLCEEHGWSMDNERNLPCAVSPSGDIRIVCVSGGPWTGMATTTPSFRKRGSRTVEAFGQIRIPGLEVGRGNPDGSFWYLITHIDEIDQKIRAEFSCPIFDEDGSAIDWAERIILGQFDLQGVPDVVSASPEAPVIDVRRRKADGE